MQRFDLPIADLAHTIQLAVAPVFLLSGIGAFLNVMTSRLARVIDRTRALEGQRAAHLVPEAASFEHELEALHQRRTMINRAIGLCTYSALLVSATVALLFVGSMLPIDLAVAVALGFIGAMILLMAGLASFLQEIHLATRVRQRVGR